MTRTFSPPLNRDAGVSQAHDLSRLSTPAMVVDAPTVRRNIERLAKYSQSVGIKIRPHTKTHKSRFLAGLQLEAGACGITVAKVSEVATPDVVATSHPIPLGTVMRADVPGVTLTADQALSGAPERDGDRFKVSAILGEEQ